MLPALVPGQAFWRPRWPHLGVVGGGICVPGDHFPTRFDKPKNRDGPAVELSTKPPEPTG